MNRHVLAFGVVAYCALAGIAAAQQPTTGPAAVHRSTAELMRAEKARAGTPRPIRIKVEKEMDREKKPNPASPSGNSYTTSTGARVNTPTIKATIPTPKAAQTIGTTWTAALLSDTNSFPPDTMGAVGPTQFLLACNGRVRTFNKLTGAADGILNADTDVFFSSAMTPTGSNGITSNFTSDPHVQYDRLSKRWFLVILDVPNGGNVTNRILFATSDAASNGVISGSTIWSFSWIPVTTYFADYPTLGVDANALYVGTNMFSLSTGNFANTNGYVIRKSSLTSGGPIVYTTFANLIGTDGPDTPQGVTNMDPGATEGYFIGASDASFGRLIVRRVTNPATSPTLSANLSITVPQTAFPKTVPHLGNTGGSNGNLDSLDDRLFAASMRGGSLWSAHNIGVDSTGAASSSATRNAVRWYELTNLTGTPTLAQSGTIFDGSATNPVFCFIPTINASGQGHVAMGFSIAGAAAHINATTSGRLSTDAAGTMQLPIVYTNSTTAYNPTQDTGANNGSRRWGDYSYVSVDPNDDMTFYTIQQFCSGTNTYGVNVARLAAPPPATPLSITPASIPANTAATTITLAGTSTNGSGFFDPGAGFANHMTASITGGVTVSSVFYVSPTIVQLGINTDGASQGLHDVTITNPDGQSRTGASLLTISAPFSAIERWKQM